MEEPSLSDIQEALREITDYFHLGVHLGIDEGVIKAIEANYGDNERRKAEVISYWRRNHSDHSWEALANAVEKMTKGHTNLAKTLRKKGSQGGQNDNSTSPWISEQDNYMEVENASTVSSAPVHLQLCLSDRLNDRPKNKELRDHVQKKIGDKWEEVGIELGLDDPEDDDADTKLDDIRAKGKDNPSMAPYYVLNSWLKDKRIRPTWGVLIEALCAVGLQEVVEAVNSYLSTSSKTPPIRGATTEAATAAQPSISQTVTDKNSEVMHVSTSQDSAVSLSSSQTSHSSTTKHYEVCLKPREYQKELARPGICGQNYIICAPTNSGKTLVAAMVIANHLEKNSLMQQKPKVVYVVKTRPLADQQTQQLSEYIHNAHVVCRTGNRGDIHDRRLQLHIEDALHSSETDVIVCTAGKLFDELNKGDISLQEFSLMIIDECHHTEHINSAFTPLMHKYLELKDAAKGQQPQILGLTATPGVGRNPGLDLAKAIDNLITLCAHMDATGGIQTVQEHKKELDQYIQRPESHLESVDHNQRKELLRIKQEMKECEQFLGFSSPFPHWSQQYEQAVKQRRIELDESGDENDRDKVSTAQLLEHYSQTLIKYLELPCAQAADYLDEYDDLIKSDKQSDHEKYLLEKFTRLKDDIKSLGVCENPILKKLESRLTEVFPGSSGIVFVRTREQAEAICKWISDSNFAEGIRINAQILVGHKNVRGGNGPVMYDEDQKQVIHAFREGTCNLLIATSVAEEGLDIKQCNLVVRLHISGARAKEQMKGRARAADSKIVTIVSHDKQKLFKDIHNDELVRLMNDLIENNGLPSPQQLQEEITRRQQCK